MAGDVETRRSWNLRLVASGKNLFAIAGGHRSPEGEIDVAVDGVGRAVHSGDIDDVAAVVAARGDGGVGDVGVAFTNAAVVPVNVLWLVVFGAEKL